MVFRTSFLAGMCASWIAFAAVPAAAQLPVSASQEVPAFNVSAPAPETQGIPFFDTLRKNGGTFYYLGERSGLYGFLIMQNGQVQMVYLPQDRKTLLIGAMFTDAGVLVTSHQIEALSKRDPSVASLMQGGATQQAAIARANAVDGGYAAIAGASEAPKGPPMTVPALPLSPGERLMMDLQAAASVVVGGAESAPELIMVVSTECAHCKRAWGELREAVRAGKVRVRLVPIARDNGSDETREAAVLLHAKDPLETWDTFAQGSKEALAGTPEPLAVRAIIANRETTDRWNILGTPYLLYRGKDGKIKIVQGKPGRMATVLADLVP